MQNYSVPYPRHRAKGEFSNLSKGPRKLTRYDGTVLDSPPNIIVSEGFKEACNDVVTPGFRKLMEQGVIINNPFHKWSCEKSGSTSGYAHSLVLATQTPPIGPTVVVKDEFPDFLAWKGLRPGSAYSETNARLQLELISDYERGELQTLVATKALSNLNKQNFQGLVFLGELRKTVDLLKNPIRSITDYLQKPWRVDRKSKLLGKGKVARWTVRNPLKEIIPLGNAGASQYLSYYYGLRNLLFDMERIVKSFEASALVRQRTSSKQEISRVRDLEKDLHTGSVLLSCKYLDQVSETVTVEAGVLFEPKMSSAYDELGFSILDVPMTVFELTPYSFCVDWAVNLSDYINSLGGEVKHNIRCQWIKTTVEREVKRTALAHTFVTHPTYAVTTHCSDSGTVVEQTVDRSPVTLGTIRGVVFRPKIDPPLLAATSLIVQLLTKGK